MDDISKRIKVEQQGASGCPVLPEEIVQDILSRLPAKSLCRFRCVSRSFDAVISSHAFQPSRTPTTSGTAAAAGYSSGRPGFASPCTLGIPAAARLKRS